MSENLSKQNKNSTMGGQSFETQIPMLRVQIMLVDDDATCLSIVSSMLKISSRQETMLQLSVVTVKSPLEALATLRVNQGLFDLVVSDLHMPEMNGNQLQKRVNEEFKLPVMIMSSDDKEQVILESLQSGAVLYAVKPLSQDDLRNIWQYAVAAKKGQSAVIEEIGSINQLGESSSSSAHELPNLVSNNNGGDINSATSVTEDRNDVANNKDSGNKKKGRKRGRDDRADEDEDDEDAPVAPKKAKVVWTNSLHNRFLQAINHIGLEKAVPKKILEFMGVPGLTRENVASHLQKYRLFLKRVAEKGAYSMRAFSERSLRSNFPTTPSFQFQDFQFDQPQFPGHKPGYIGNTITSNFAPSRFPHQEPSGTNSVPTQYLYGQSRLPGNSSGFQQPSFGNPNPSYQANRSGSGFQLGYPGTNSWPQGGMPYGRINANGMTNNASLMPPHQQQGQVRPSNSRFGSIEIGSIDAGYASGFGNMGAVNNTSNPPLNANNTGMRMDGNEHPVGMEQMQVNGNQRPTWFNNYSGHGLMNENFNNNVNNVAPTNGTLGYSTLGGPGSIGFGNGNPMPQAFNSFNQGNGSRSPSLQQQRQFGPRNGAGQNCYNNSTFSAISNQNQLQHGGVNVGGSLFNSNNILQPGVASGIQNVNVLQNSGHPEMNPPMSQLLNTGNPSSYNIQQNTHGQLQDGEQVVNTGFIGNRDSQNDYHPIFEQQRTEGLIDSVELHDIFPVDNCPLGTESWREDFIDTLFDNDTY